MDWRARLAEILDAIGGLSVPVWVAPTSTLISLVLLLVLLTLLARHLRLRRELAQRTAGAAAASFPVHQEDQLPAVSLEGDGHALIDRWLPRRPRNFLLAIAVLAIGCWVAGLALASDVVAFLASREWQIQPFYLVAHFVTLRLFATAFTRTFLAGIVHLDIDQALARRRMRLVLGPAGALVAALVAAPLCLYDYRTLTAGTGGEGAGWAADWLLLGLWCAEWFVMATIWVMLAGYMLLAHWAFAKHRFRAAIEVVLHDRQYRPFLQMSAQGATSCWGSGSPISCTSGTAERRSPTMRVR